MADLSPISRIPLPTDDDILDYSSICQDFCTFVDSILVPRYASATARDAAHSGGAIAGEICTVEDSSGSVKLQTYTGAGWATVNESEVVYKDAPTSRSTTSTPTADPHLVVNLLPNSQYFIRARTGWDSTSSNPDIRVRWIVVTGSGLTVLSRSVFSGADGAGGGGGQHGFFAWNTNEATNVDIELVANSVVNVESNLYVQTSTSAITLAFAWSQASSNAAALNLLAGSFLEVDRIA